MLLMVHEVKVYKSFEVTCMYAANFSLMVLNFPSACFSTSCESLKMSMTSTSKCRASLRPAISPSYYASLLVVGNVHFTTCLKTKPSGLVKITHAPSTCEMDEPSVNKVHALSSGVEIISTRLCGSVMKSANACNFIAVLG